MSFASDARQIADKILPHTSEHPGIDRKFIEWLVSKVEEEDKDCRCYRILLFWLRQVSS